MLKINQTQLIKYGALLLAGLYVFKKINAAKVEAVEFAKTKLNPASQENIIYTATTDAVGKENFSKASLSFFDSIDTAAEWFGIENGINGIPGTTAEANERIKNG